MWNSEEKRSRLVEGSTEANQNCQRVSSHKDTTCNLFDLSSGYVCDRNR